MEHHEGHQHLELILKTIGLGTQFEELQEEEAQDCALGKATTTGNVEGAGNRRRAAGPSVTGPCRENFK